ncbi:hypothetical protein QKU48_gp0591 [Fadolivirus algeromassiliense]|jgi:hypothetical protein|uniref:Uncharacterized protein n=1 Tax=Fadolivirus FV1/VV64 TaxID=3070911 RepID=A0A7D3UV98_9VIRU|nr:hypothetical protein QKU48_gp0591 [Fadolivirus algeromassiliense]QKF94049.1 hypothetical protein Fadolivirus_1_591 [Fadolivirus FV1/VV64]
MNNQFENNRLLSGYQQYNQTSIPTYQNNILLKNNPIFSGNNQMHQMNQMQQMQQMQMLQQMQMQQIKEMQQIKQMEKINELENNMDKEKIRESVIKPIKIEKNKKARQELEENWRVAEKKYIDPTKKSYGPEVQEYWKQRTNQPYRGIMKNEDYNKQFKSKDDLIVHRVTNKDKEGVEEGFKVMESNIEKHNNELKVIYSTSNKNDHKKKFEYNHVYKYRVQYDPNDHDKLKENRVKYYKEQQKKEEEGKQKIDNIFETLVNDGIFDKNELNSINVNVKNQPDNDSTDSNKSTQSIKSNDISKQEKRDKYLNRRKQV